MLEVRVSLFSPLNRGWPSFRRSCLAWLEAGKELLGCSLGSLDTDVADKVRLQQLKLTSILMPVKLLIGALTVLLISYEYWRSLDHFTLVVFCAALLGLYVSLLEICRRCGFGSRIATGTMGRLHRRYVLLTGLLGLVWGMLFFMLMRSTSLAERSLLDGLVIGLMSTAVVSTPASVAIAFWLPVTLGGFAAITFVADARDLGTTALLAGYATLSLFCLLYLNRALIKRIVAELRHSEGRETIDMLLRDFEDSAGDWLWETDLRGRLTHVSEPVRRGGRRARGGADGTGAGGFHRLDEAPQSRAVHRSPGGRAGTGLVHGLPHAVPRRRGGAGHRRPSGLVGAGGKTPVLHAPVVRGLPGCGLGRDQGQAGAWPRRFPGAFRRADGARQPAIVQGAALPTARRPGQRPACPALPRP